MIREAATWHRGHLAAAYGGIVLALGSIGYTSLPGRSVTEADFARVELRVNFLEHNLPPKWLVRDLAAIKEIQAENARQIAALRQTVYKLTLAVDSNSKRLTRAAAGG